VNFTALDLGAVKNKRVWEFQTNYIRLEEMVAHSELQKHQSHLFVAELFRQGRLWNFAMRSLFKPGQKVQELIKKIFEEENISPTTFKIGLHLRIGDSAEMTTNDNTQRRKRKQYSERFWRSAYRTVPMESVLCFAQRALRYWNELPKRERVQFKPKPVFFVSSDSSPAMNIVIQHIQDHGYQIFQTEKYAGRIKHLAKTHGDQTRVYLDWFLLGMMDRIVVSQSGFSEASAKYACVESSVFHRIEGNYGDCVNQFHDFYENGHCNPMADIWNLYEIFPELIEERKQSQITLEK